MTAHCIDLVNFAVCLFADRLVVAITCNWLKGCFAPKWDVQAPIYFVILIYEVNNMTEQELIHFSHKMLNRFILKSRQFCDCYCIPDGLADILMSFNATRTIKIEVKFSEKLAYDYDYLAFTKSTKTLIALKSLLKDGTYFFNEDSLMLIRSIFENHIMSRYVREHIDIDVEKKGVVKKFILNPLSVTLNYFSLQGADIIDHEGNPTGKIPMPAKYKMGKEVDYYSGFYQFLCQYTHCSFGALLCYFDEKLYTYRKNNFQLLTLFFSLFVFTKVYEGVVTVEGENYGAISEEKSYYDLGYDSIELQLKLIDFLTAYYMNRREEKLRFIIEKYLGEDDYDKENMKIVEMLGSMRESLFDSDIGSLDKSQIENGHFVRKYPTYGFSG